MILAAAVITLIAGMVVRIQASQPPKRTELEELVAQGEPEQHVHALVIEPDGTTFAGLHTGIFASKGTTGWKLQPGSEGDTMSLAPAGGTDLYVANPAMGIGKYTGGKYEVLLAGQGHTVAVDPKDRGHVLGFLLELGLQESRDGGKTWNRIVDPGQIDLLTLAISPADSNLYVAGGLDGLFGISKDGGKNWTWSTLPYGVVTSLAFDPANPTRLWAAMGGALYFSDNAGSTWTRAENKAGDHSVIAIAFPPGQSGPRAVATDGYLFNQ